RRVHTFARVGALPCRSESILRNPADSDADGRLRGPATATVAGDVAVRDRHMRVDLSEVGDGATDDPDLGGRGGVGPVHLLGELEERLVAAVSEAVGVV